MQFLLKQLEEDLSCACKYVQESVPVTFLLHCSSWEKTLLLPSPDKGDPSVGREEWRIREDALLFLVAGRKVTTGNGFPSHSPDQAKPSVAAVVRGTAAASPFSGMRVTLVWECAGSRGSSSCRLEHRHTAPLTKTSSAANFWEICTARKERLHRPLFSTGTKRHDLNT